MVLVEVLKISWRILIGILVGKADHIVNFLRSHSFLKRTFFTFEKITKKWTQIFHLFKFCFISKDCHQRVNGVNPKKFNNMQIARLHIYQILTNHVQLLILCLSCFINTKKKNLRLVQYLSQKKLLTSCIMHVSAFWNCGKSSMSYVNEGGREFQSLEYINILWYFAAQSLLPTIQNFFSKKALNFFTYI